MLLHTGIKPVFSRNKLLTTVAWKLGDRVEYALEGSVFIAGAAVQWLRDGLSLIKNAADIEALAGSVPDSGGVTFVPALTGLGAPAWDPTARGAILGLTRGVTSAHLARATLESIAFQSADLLGAMQADSKIRLRELRVDGGASVNNLLMQMQADLAGLPVLRPKVSETTALGAAYLAGWATGVWGSAKQIASQWQLDRKFMPKMSISARQKASKNWNRGLERARGWVD